MSTGIQEKSENITNEVIINSETRKSEQEWPCPACTFLNAAVATICEMCGTKNSSREGSKNDIENESDIWACEACSMRNPSNCSICYMCGTSNPNHSPEAHVKWNCVRCGNENTQGTFCKLCGTIYAPSDILTDMKISFKDLESLIERPGPLLVDKLQILTHALAVKDASSENDGFIFASRLGKLSSTNTSSQLQLAKPLSKIILNNDFPIAEAQLLACQALNYIMKLSDPDDMNLISAYFEVLKQRHEVNGGRKSLVEEILTGLGNILGRSCRYLESIFSLENLILILNFVEKVGKSNYHDESFQSAFKVIQKFCLFLQLKQEKVEGSSKGKSRLSSNIASHETLPVSQKILEKLVHAVILGFRYKNDLISLQALKCFNNLIYNSIPNQSIFTSEILEKLMQCLMEKLDNSKSLKIGIDMIDLVLQDSSCMVNIFLKEDVIKFLLNALEHSIIKKDDRVCRSLLQLLERITSIVLKKDSSSPIRPRKELEKTTAGGQKGGENNKRKACNIAQEHNTFSLQSLLMKFIKSDAISLVRMMIDAGADLNHDTPHEDPPIVEAVKYSSLALVRLLLRKGAKIDTMGPSGTALHVAAKEGRADLVYLLLTEGANKSLKDPNNQRADEIENEVVSHIFSELNGNRSQFIGYAFSDDLFMNSVTSMDSSEDHDSDEECDLSTDEEDFAFDHRMKKSESSESKKYFELNGTSDTFKKKDIQKQICSLSQQVFFTQTAISGLLHGYFKALSQEIKLGILSITTKILEIAPFKAIEEISETTVEMIIHLISSLIVKQKDDFGLLMFGLRIFHAMMSKAGSKSLFFVYIHRRGLIPLLKEVVNLNNIELSKEEEKKKRKSMECISQVVDDLVKEYENNYQDEKYVESMEVVQFNINTKDNDSIIKDLTYFRMLLQNKPKRMTFYEFSNAKYPMYLKAACVDKGIDFVMSQLCISYDEIIYFIELLQEVIIRESNLSIYACKGDKYQPICDPLKLRMCPYPNENGSPEIVSVPPLFRFQQMQKAILRNLPFHDIKYQRYCYSLIQVQIDIKVSGKWKEGKIRGFDAKRLIHLVEFENPKQIMKDRMKEILLHEQEYRLKSCLNVGCIVPIDYQMFGEIEHNSDASEELIHTNTFSSNGKKAMKINKRKRLSQEEELDIDSISCSKKIKISSASCSKKELNENNLVSSKSSSPRSLPKHLLSLGQHLWIVNSYGKVIPGTFLCYKKSEKNSEEEKKIMVRVDEGIVLIITKDDSILYVSKMEIQNDEMNNPRRGSNYILNQLITSGFVKQNQISSYLEQKYESLKRIISDPTSFHSMDSSTKEIVNYTSAIEKSTKEINIEENQQSLKKYEELKVKTMNDLKEEKEEIFCVKQAPQIFLDIGFIDTWRNSFLMEYRSEGKNLLKQKHLVDAKGDVLSKNAIQIFTQIFTQISQHSGKKLFPFSLLQSKKKKAKKHLENNNNVSQNHLLSFDKFQLLMKQIFQHPPKIHDAILFSRFALLEEKRNKMNVNGFLSLMYCVCKITEKEKKIISFLKTNLGYKDEDLFNVSDQNQKVELHRIDPDMNIMMMLSSLGNDITKNHSFDIIYNLHYQVIINWEGMKSKSSQEVSLKHNTIIEDKGKVKELDSYWHFPLEGLSQDKTNLLNETSNVLDAFKLLKILYDYLRKHKGLLNIKSESWINSKLHHRIESQLEDAITVATMTFPPWIYPIVSEYKFMIPLSTRNKVFRATAFGWIRSVQWYKDQHPKTDGENRFSNRSNLVLPSVSKERMTVHRDQLLKYAETTMRNHAKKKTLLDIVFEGERGYGSGVTASFYSSVAEMLSSCNENKNIPCWLEDDQHEKDCTIRHPNGLFPKPIPSNSKQKAAVINRFLLMGRLTGKALMDKRLFPLPFSVQFLKLVLGETISTHEIEDIFQQPGRIILKLWKACVELHSLESDKIVYVEGMQLEEWLSAASLSFVDPLTNTPFDPSQPKKEVNSSNVTDFIKKALNFWLNDGISSQILAFRRGIEEVFPMEKLLLFTAEECIELICGCADVDWNNESLKRDMKPGHGYTNRSQPYEWLLQCLDEMDAKERREFILFSTGCPSLPGGGLASLQPSFEIVRRQYKGDSADKALPFARTCTNTLHLPPYSSKEMLKAQLTFAMANSKGVIDRD